MRGVDSEEISRVAAALGRRGGRVGGKAKVAKGFSYMTPERRAEIQELSRAALQKKKKANRLAEAAKAKEEDRGAGPDPPE